MEIKTLSKDKDKLTFLIKGINFVIANTIRRLIIDKVPCMAIEEVNFLKNSSALYDEIIAHRLGLVPFKTDLKSYVLKEDCRCKGKGCARCQLNIKLKEKGPCTVYSEGLKTRDPKVKPVYGKMPIVKLLKGQDLEIEAVAVLGEGEDHQKFSPGLAFYKAYPEFDIKTCSACGKCVEQCPPKILKLAGKKVKVTDVEKCTLCKACEDVCPSKSIKVEGSKENFIFYIESFGQLKPKEMVLKAADIFDKKLDEFNKQVKKLK